MSVKLRAALDAAQKFYHDVDTDSEKFINRVAGMHVRRQDTFIKAHKTLDGAVANLDEVDKLMSDLAQTNGGPTLDDSKESSEASGHDGEPGKSWANGQT